MSAKLPIIKEPLPALREERQSIAIAAWGSPSLISNQTDIISSGVRLTKRPLPAFTTQIRPSPFRSYGVHTSRITPLNPPLY